MKNDLKKELGALVRLTPQSLETLKSRGFRFVLVKGLTKDNRLDYMEPHCLVLVPVKELSGDPGKKEIYEPIDSKILINWASGPDDGIEVRIAAV